MFDRDRFEERAAIMEHDGGMSRFQAETQAARLQGVERWEVIGDVAKRVVEQARNNGSALAGQSGPDYLPGVQSHPAKEG